MANRAFYVLLLFAALLAVACGSDTPAPSPSRPGTGRSRRHRQPLSRPPPNRLPTPAPTPAPRVEPTPSPQRQSRTPTRGSRRSLGHQTLTISRFADETWAFLERFTEEMSPRESATAEEEAAAEYLTKELRSSRLRGRDPALHLRATGAGKVAAAARRGGACRHPAAHVRAGNSLRPSRSRRPRKGRRHPRRGPRRTDRPHPAGRDPVRGKGLPGRRRRPQPLP